MISNITNEYIIEFQYNKNHDSGPLTKNNCNRLIVSIIWLSIF